MTITRFVLAGILLNITAVAQDGKQWEGFVKETGISITEAIDRGLKQAGKGFVYHAELELDGGQLVYSIDVWQEGGGVNVVLDAKTGKFKEKEKESDDVSKAVAACKVDLKRAIGAAQEAGRRHVIDAELRLRGGNPEIRLKTLRNGTFETLTVDAVTGKLSGPRPENAAMKAGEESKAFQDTFAVDKADLVPHGKNPFFILEPGWRLELEGKEGKDTVRAVITVLKGTRKVDGVECAILEERESKNGQLAEVSRNFFAISKKSNAVYYFGEEVDDYKDGKVVSHGGAWESGKDGARFGLFMPGTPVVGSRFYNEYAPRIALDRAEIVSVTATVETAAGTFKDCVRWRETTPLEPGAKDHKAFGRGIGYVQDGPLKLVKYGMLAPR